MSLYYTLPMKLYLVQHGQALSKDVDPECPLSDQGVSDVEQLATHLHGRIAVDSIYHSSKLRAAQTANIIAETLGVAHCEQLDGLKPMDDVQAIINVLPDFQAESIMLVGHLPFMNRLVNALLERDGELNAAQFVPGTLVGLADTDGKWSISELLPPTILA